MQASEFSAKSGGTDFAAHQRLIKQTGKRLWWPGVGEQSVDLRQMPDFNHGGTVEFAAVCAQPDFARLVEDGLGNFIQWLKCQ